MLKGKNNISIFFHIVIVLTVAVVIGFSLGTKIALGSYTSANLKMAVSFYKQIIDRMS